MTVISAGHEVEVSTRRVALAVLILVVAYAAGLAWALAYDARVDRHRTVYTDTRTMADLQTVYAEEHGGQALSLEAGPGESVAVGGSQFTPAPGNTVQVIAADVGFCVRSQSADPDARPWTYDSAEIGDEYSDRVGGACG